MVDDVVIGDRVLEDEEIRRYFAAFEDSLSVAGSDRVASPRAVGRTEDCARVVNLPLKGDGTVTVSTAADDTVDLSGCLDW